MAQELRANSIQCYSNSQLMVNQVLGEYQARGTKMAAYLAKVKKELFAFEHGLIEQIPREKNANVDTLTKLHLWGGRDFGAGAGRVLGKTKHRGS